MVVVRKTGTHSSSPRPAADTVSPPVRRSGSSADGPPVKVAHLSINGESETITTSDATRRPSTPAITVTALQTPIKSLNADVRSLERYVLTTLAATPEVNAQGFWTYKGNHYVNLVQGGVVQVRQAPGTDRCRARLASELAPGPLLVLDRQTMAWALAPSQPLSDIGNAVDFSVRAHSPEHQPRAKVQGAPDDPSDAGHHRPDAENEVPIAVHDGQNDRFETAMTEGEVLAARGLRQFPEEKAAIVRSELLAVERIFTDAQSAIRANYGETDKVLASYFGSAHRIIKSRLIDALQRGQSLSAEYQGVWGVNKINGVLSSTELRQGWMNPDDFHGRIFINLSEIRDNTLRVLLGHEFLHTARISRFKSIGPSTRDYFYLDIRAQSSLNRPVPAHDSEWRGISEVIMQGGLTLDYLNAFGINLSWFVAGVREHSGVAGVQDIDTALILFNSSAAVRAQMAARNADSIICAAHDLQRLHQAHLADDEWLKSLVNG
ncbi:Protein kinase domain-containing protein [Pseudomonas sp. IT-347P]|uniref:hypothetical protein n=1 Tax=Pseudomonas sp. IT-347P TaxID=3026458 RepID=UPI0039E011D5